MNPFGHSSGFMDLLTSQQESQTVFDDDLEDMTDEASLGGQKPKSRRSWSHTEDVVLISAWLNTSKDAVIGNEQKGSAFWSRIAAYYAASPKLDGVEKRQPLHCKHRWQRINDTVCKFVGSYDAATKAKSSGQNEDDVMKLAYDIFFSDYKVKFHLEHAWRELRYDQKWLGAFASKDKVPVKRRRHGDEQTGSSSVQVRLEEEEARPPGVKAAKGRSKQPSNKPTTVDAEGKALSDFREMWEIKQQDLMIKRELGNQRLLESLLAKTEELSEKEMALKDKLLTDLMG